MRPPLLLICALGIVLNFAGLKAQSLQHFGDMTRNIEAARQLDTVFHYEPAPGKLLGIYSFALSSDDLNRLRHQFGFSGLNLEGDSVEYMNALSAGFQVENLVLSMHEDYAQLIPKFAAGTYYIDEVVEHDCSGHSARHIYPPGELASIRDSIHSHRPGSKFATSAYKLCNHNVIASSYVDIIQYSSYKNWTQFSLPICHVNMGWGDEYERPWIAGSDDQRSGWTTMHNMFGTKFSMAWVTATGDEYANLFQHANTLGLTGVWLYDPNPFDSTFFESFCNIAWQNGWLNKVPDTPLPIQLSSFTGLLLEGRRVLLEWTTLSEINNYGFVIQRKLGISEEFQDVPGGFVPGNGTTNEPRHFSFIDDSVSSNQAWYRLKQIDLDGTIHYTDPISIEMVTGVGENDIHEFVVLQNYPNPFNPITNIKFQITSTSFVTLKVFDVLGREVATLVDEEMSAGTYERIFNGSGLGSGVYFYRLQAGGLGLSKQLILLR